jgi:tetratricopeptide (TPR) repeat protein
MCKLSFRFCLIFLLLLILRVNFALAAIDSEIMYAQGCELYLAGEYEKARGLLAPAALLDPQNPGIHLTLGLCQLALQDFQPARDNFRQALQLDPNIPGGYLYLGISAYFLKDFRESRANLSKAKELAPKNGLASYYLGLAALHLNHPREAVTEFRRSRRLNPELAVFCKTYEDLALVPADVRPQPVRLSLMAGAEYDSNVPLLTDRESPYVRKRGSSVDWAGRLGSRFEVYPVMKPNYNFGARLKAFYDAHTWLDNWNWCNARLEVFSNFKVGPVLIEPLFAYDKTFYAGARYSDFSQYGVILNWPETNWLKGEIIYRALNKSFRYGTILDNRRSGWEHQVGLFQGLTLSNIGVLRIGAAFERDLAEGSWITASTVRTSLNSVIFLPWEVTWWTTLEYAYTHFDNLTYDWNAYNFQGVYRKRSDNVFSIQLLLKKPVTQKLSCWLGYGYNTQESINKSYQYDRHLVTFLLSWDFF